jgi:hypothetical protein
MNECHIIETALASQVFIVLPVLGWLAPTAISSNLFLLLRWYSLMGSSIIMVSKDEGQGYIFAEIQHILTFMMASTMPFCEPYF